MNIYFCILVDTIIYKVLNNLKIIFFGRNCRDVFCLGQTVFACPPLD